MSQFKIEACAWEADDREVLTEAKLNISPSLDSHATSSSTRTGGDSIDLLEDQAGDGYDSVPIPGSGRSDRPHSPQPTNQSEPPPIFLKGLTWGFEVLQALDADDPKRLMASLMREGANPKAQVDKDGLGGHQWSMWAFRQKGDTVLHLALRWKKTRALSGLYPLSMVEIPDPEGGLENVPNDFFDLDCLRSEVDNLTANELCLRVHGISLSSFWRNSKKEALREAAEERQRRRLAFEQSVAAGHARLVQAHERTAMEYRLAVRGVGASREADLLLGQRRVLAPPSLAPPVDPEARIEARRNLLYAAGLKPPRGEVPRERPGERDDFFPVDVNEVSNVALKSILGRLRDGRLAVERLSTRFELKYAGAIGPKGAIDLAACLSAAPHLTILSLPHQRIGPVGGAALARGIKSCPTLTYVDLRSNCLEDAGVEPLADALEGNPSLATLCLDANRFKGLALVANIAALLAQGKGGDGLVHLSLTCNEIPDGPMEALHAAAKKAGIARRKVIKVFPRSEESNKKPKTLGGFCF
eukprot:CAMPEP_0172606860 /NCGR_PEP_ID=MMETSP1068-20121228/27065_1 /TAXON_ID=35684 /ORGANISM="Pseudopedinella elastica, Strain CCMP716" /LENGTH=528 /DNA_ID=CAMNT_0013409713 /DNA_START=86 /DNA_END=1672 /DNA_ORIENTATION=+